MPSYSRNEVILVRYPFSNSSGAKIRPAVVVSASHPSHDVFIVPLMSNVSPLLAGEFELVDWKSGCIGFDEGSPKTFEEVVSLRSRQLRSLMEKRFKLE
jgi:hypothetical protein